MVYLIFLCDDGKHCNPELFFQNDSQISLASDQEAPAHRVIMVSGKIACHLESKLFMARRCFKRDVLRMLPSDLDKGQE